MVINYSLTTLSLLKFHSIDFTARSCTTIELVFDLDLDLIWFNSCINNVSNCTNLPTCLRFAYSVLTALRIVPYILCYSSKPPTYTVLPDTPATKKNILTPIEQTADGQQPSTKKSKKHKRKHRAHAENESETNMENATEMVATNEQANSYLPPMEGR